MSGRRVVVFGSGKMACGALGPLLTRAGHESLFIARREDVVASINRNGGYRLTEAAHHHRERIRHCRAIHIEDAAEVVRAVADVDLVMTAVGIDNLGAVAPLVAEGLWRRSQAPSDGSVNVVACENLPGAGAYLRHTILTAARQRSLVLDGRVGFSAGLTRRIMTGGDLRDGELWFAVSGDPELVVDREGLKGSLPRIKGLVVTTDFEAVVMRKLFTLNLAQAVAAYLGYRHACTYLHESAMHPAVAPVVQGAVRESCAALAAEFPRQRRQISREARLALEEICNPALGDTVRRVARDPRRKLSAMERLVGPARLAIRHRLPYESLCLAICAALAYDEPSDPSAQELQRTIAIAGVDKVLTVDCGLLPYETLARAVKERRSALAPAEK